MQKIGLMEVAVRKAGEPVIIPDVGSRSFLAPLNQEYSPAIASSFNEVIQFFSVMNSDDILKQQYSVEMRPGAELTRVVKDVAANFSFYLSVTQGVPALFSGKYSLPIIPLGMSSHFAAFEQAWSVERAAISATIASFFEPVSIHAISVAMGTIDPPVSSLDSREIIDAWKKWCLEGNGKTSASWRFTTTGGDLLTSQDYENQFVELNGKPVFWISWR